MRLSYWKSWIGILFLVAFTIISAQNPKWSFAQEATGFKSNNERHLMNIRQLTVGGKNAEAYFSFDGSKLIFQSTREQDRNINQSCYQIYTMDLDGTNVRRVSTAFGGTTCGYYFPGGRRVLFSSTHLKDLNCPPEPKQGGRYRWALHDHDIFSFRVDGQDPHRLTATPGYDAEATISPDGKTIVYTSVHNGDLDIYSMNLDGTNTRQLTNETGYDGGAFFSPDSQKIVYRASHPKTQEELQAYQDLLIQNLVEPSFLEIFVMRANGSNKQQITRNGFSNFAPSFYPDGHYIIFSSNVSSIPSSKGRPSFHLHLINEDGTGIEQITFEGKFNSFPMFSPDGKKLVWTSDRNPSEPREFNVFIADWVP